MIYSNFVLRWGKIGMVSVTIHRVSKIKRRSCDDKLPVLKELVERLLL